MSKHREDHLRLGCQSGWGVGQFGTIGKERLSLLTSPIVNDHGMAAFLQVRRHAASHYTQTDETNFHLCLQMRVLGREFGYGLNLLEVRLREVNCRASNHVVDLLRFASSDDRGSYGGMAQ